MSVLARIDGVGSRQTQLPVGLAPGTNVRTPCGPRRVENLRPGDLIVTRQDGLQPVRMIWKRTIAAAEVAADPSLAPIVITPRAVGPMMPQTELRVASAHGILLPGYRVEGVRDTDICMIRARDFATQSEAAHVDRRNREAVYVSLMFDRHQIFAASGLFVESFLPTPVSVAGFDEADLEELERVLPGAAEGKADYPPIACPVWNEMASLSA